MGVRPRELAEPQSFAVHGSRFVYNLELHGHDDTVMIECEQHPVPIVACTLGKFCGEYNIFTRKTVRCLHECLQCDSVFVEGPSPFANLRVVDLDLRFPPYPED